MENNSQFIADLLYLLQVTGLSDLPTILVYVIPVAIAVVLYVRTKNNKVTATCEVATGDAASEVFMMP